MEIFYFFDEHFHVKFLSTWPGQLRASLLLSIALADAELYQMLKAEVILLIFELLNHRDYRLQIQGNGTPISFLLIFPLSPPKNRN